PCRGSAWARAARPRRSPVSVAGQLEVALILIERAAELDRLGRAEDLALPGDQPEAIGQPLAQQLLDPQVADRQLTSAALVLAAEQGQAITVGAGDRRIAVDDGRQHRERVALADRGQLDPRSNLDAAGQPRGLDRDRQLLAKLGQELADQRADLALAEDLALAQGLEALGREPVIADRVERATPTKRAVVE